MTARRTAALTAGAILAGAAMLCVMAARTWIELVEAEDAMCMDWGDDDE